MDIYSYLKKIMLQLLLMSLVDVCVCVCVVRERGYAMVASLP
jgi:hypothetical protein